MMRTADSEIDKLIKIFGGSFRRKFLNNKIKSYFYNLKPMI